MGLFSKKNKDVEKVETDDKAVFASNTKTFEPSMDPDLISMNDGVNICALACASCWDTKLPDSYQDRMKYIGKRTKTGHTSIIEHSNVVFYVPVDLGIHSDDLVEFLSWVKYANTVVKFSKKFNIAYMIIGGSWRAFADIYLNANTIAENAIMRKITDMIYRYIPSDGMRDIIDYGILDESLFANNPSNEISLYYCYGKYHRIDDDIQIINMDSFKSLKESICLLCPEPYLFNKKDLMKMLTVTIEFNNMSRIITQQLTRHRNGITQESQRYVDYTGAPFNSPAKFKPDKYDANYLYTIKFGDKQFRMNLQTIGNAINSIYGQLTDKLINGDKILMKEDARGYLGQNTQCGRIYMTFTYYSLAKFLQLREDNHAQAEIRTYGIRIGEWIRKNFENEDKVFENDVYEILLPNMTSKSAYMNPIVDPKGDDGITIDGNEVSENMTQEEYEKIIGDSIKYADDHPEDVDK